MEDYSLLFEVPNRTRPASKLKPNTRFLQHIVREANSHNAALLAKETAEARARLRQLSRRSKTADGESDNGASDRRGSHLRRRREVEEGDHPSYRQRHRRHEDDKDQSEDEGKGYEKEESTRSRSSKHHSRRHSHRPRRDSRSRSPNRSGRNERGKHSHRSRSPRERDRDRAKRHLERSLRAARERSDSKKNVFDSGSDSDPLSEFVGPLPVSDTRPDTAIRIRGRGAMTGASSMDRHFANDYDPSEDVEMEGPHSSNPTVDDARLEMERDRQKLLRDGAERLRNAGFTDREIAIWSRGGKRDVDDVQWVSKGEAREWDRGKLDGDTGRTKPEWAR